MALLMGLTGSLHCAGMCGPIIFVMPFGIMKGMKKWLGITLYHLARISIYALMGLVLHSFKDLFHPQWQQYISIALGVSLLTVGFLSFVPNHKLSISLPWAGFVKKQLGHFIGNPNLFSLFMAGLLNGLLPCGLEYMALSSTVVASTGTQAVVLMYVFGLGTIPMMVAITILKHQAGILRMPNIKKLVPVTLLFFGSILVVRGMNLGIPYLSPKMTVINNEVKMCCCHKQ
jgi:sulfite exporter TauE/SafE